MERFFCFGKKDFCENDDACFGCEFETGDGGITESKLSAIFEKFLGENYDLDRLRNLANQRMTMREDVAQRVQITKGIDLDRLREICSAERDKRCVVLPCQIRTPVWSSCFTTIDKNGEEHPTGPWDFSVAMMDEWGKSWHLTQEDAEAAMKGDQDGKDNVSSSDHF